MSKTITKSEVLDLYEKVLIDVTTELSIVKLYEADIFNIGIMYELGEFLEEQLPVYNYNIRHFLTDVPGAKAYISDAAFEFGIDSSCFDIDQVILQGIYYYNREQCDGYEPLIEAYQILKSVNDKYSTEAILKATGEALETLIDGYKGCSYNFSECYEIEYKPLSKVA